MNPQPDTFTKRQLAERLQISARTFDRVRHRHPAIKALAGTPLRFCVKTYETWRAGGSPAQTSATTNTREYFTSHRRYA
jgi:hypothetical protein